jgi:hypothetical protein
LKGSGLEKYVKVKIERPDEKKRWKSLILTQVTLVSPAPQAQLSTNERADFDPGINSRWKGDIHHTEQKAYGLRLKTTGVVIERGEIIRFVAGSV